MENLVPRWLLDELQVTKSGDSDIQILGFSIKVANVQSNTSCFYEVMVEYENGDSQTTENFIIKFARNKQNSFVSHFDFASKEPIIYKDFLPRVNEKVNYKFAPDGFTCSLLNGIVLKDLTKDNYYVCDKIKQLDFAHCEKVFVTIAKFHAASVSCHHDNARLVEIVGEEVIYVPGGPTESELKQSLDHSFNLFLQYLSETHISKEFLDFISSRNLLLGKSVIKICQPRSNGLNVLNHGDLWTNNILFQYDGNGGIKNVKFIDFQLSRWTSPVVDLLFFIWTSANEDVRSTKLQPLFKTYLKTLNEQLVSLGCAERMTLRELKEEITSSFDWVLGTISLTFPVIIAENDIGSSQNVYEGKNFRMLVPSMIENFQVWYNLGKIII